jgi:hypothetical protein
MTLQLFGTGLGRTGTMSLKLALEQLGLGPCHHMVEVFAKPERVPLWIAAGAAHADWDAIFEGYNSAVDYPSCRFWRELMAYYPEAKMIHTVRDPARWFASTQETIFSPQTVGATGDGPLAAFFNIFMADYGGHMHERDFMLDYYRRHTETVLATVPKERLLVFEVAQGWEPLCAFLGVPAPATPFPRENSTADFKARFASGSPGSAPMH